MPMLEILSEKILVCSEICIDSRKKNKLKWNDFQKSSWKNSHALLKTNFINSRRLYFIEIFQSQWSFEGLYEVIKSRGVIRIINFWRKKKRTNCLKNRKKIFKRLKKHNLGIRRKLIDKKKLKIWWRLPGGSILD